MDSSNVAGKRRLDPPDSPPRSKKKVDPSSEDDDDEVFALDDLYHDSPASMEVCHHQGGSPSALVTNKPTAFRAPRRVETTTLPACGSTPVRVDILDPEEHFKGHFGRFVLALRDALPDDASVLSADATPTGFRVRTTQPQAIFQAMSAPTFRGLRAAFITFTKVVDVVVRRVPTSASETELLDDLKREIGSAARAVRRLHATTEDKPDRSRPIPVVVVSVEETAVSLLSRWRLFGLVPLQPSAKPARQSNTPQCGRCYRWGHASGSCTYHRRCAGCGSSSHIISACHALAQQASKVCINCDGPHSVRYRGCPTKTKEERRIREAIAPPPATRRSVQPREASRPVQEGLLFSEAANPASAAALPPAAPIPHPAPVPAPQPQRLPRCQPRAELPSQAPPPHQDPQPGQQPLLETAVPKRRRRREQVPSQSPPETPARPQPHLSALQQRRDGLRERLDRIQDAQRVAPSRRFSRKAAALRKSLRFVSARLREARPAPTCPAATSELPPPAVPVPRSPPRTGQNQPSDAGISGLADVRAVAERGVASIQAALGNRPGCEAFVAAVSSLVAASLQLLELAPCL